MSNQPPPLRPPVSIDALMDAWSTDAEIRDDDPQKEMAKIPSLHAKYVRILSHHSLMVKKLTNDYAKLRDLKRRYYTGELNGTDLLDANGWEPYEGKVYKPEMASTLDADLDLSNIIARRSVHEEIVDTCTSIIKQIQNRTYQINGIIAWNKFIMDDKQK